MASSWTNRISPIESYHCIGSLQPVCSLSVPIHFVLIYLLLTVGYLW